MFFSQFAISREIGETLITTEDGIEVYQDEKYYLLKKNVNIQSDNFTLDGDTVKIFFDKDLYDIIRIEASGNIKLISKQYKIKGSGNFLDFNVKDEKIIIKGINSILNLNDISMTSDKYISVNNSSGDFMLEGENSKLFTNDIFIDGYFIDGTFSHFDNNKEIISLLVKDENIAYIEMNDTKMYAQICKYDKKKSFIELEENVKIVRGNESIAGDYGSLDTKNNSYKVKSKKSNRVKVVITNNDG